MGITFNDNSEPFGPSAPMKGLSVANTRANPAMEKAFFDTDLAARDAITEMYFKGLPVSQLQKALAAGTWAEEQQEVRPHAVEHNRRGRHAGEAQVSSPSSSTRA